MLEKLLAALRAQLAVDAAPRRLQDLVVALLTEMLSPFDASEQAERYTRRLSVRLSQVQDELRLAGEDPWFAFNSASTDYVQGPCFCEPSDPPEVQAAKRNRLRMEPLKMALEQLTFDEFEVVCTAILAILGAREYRRTKRSRDQGIDFYGRLVLGDLDTTLVPFFRFADTMSVWLVGQAKHYPNNRVSTPEVRNLVGSINLARFKEYASTTELMTLLPLKSCDPVFALFLTTGTFTKDAVLLARNSGVVVKQVQDLAKLLADKGIGLSQSGAFTARDLAAWAAQLTESQPPALDDLQQLAM